MREREREKDKESIRIGKERKSPCKTDVPTLYAYNECEHSVLLLLGVLQRNRLDPIFKTKKAVEVHFIGSSGH